LLKPSTYELLSEYYTVKLKIGYSTFNQDLVGLPYERTARME